MRASEGQGLHEAGLGLSRIVPAIVLGRAMKHDPQPRIGRHFRPLLRSLACCAVAALENSTWKSQLSRFESGLNRAVKGFGAGKLSRPGGAVQQIVCCVRVNLLPEFC